MPLETVHQYILPTAHFITRMIINYKHVRSGRFGANYVLVKLMQKFWLCGGAATVRSCIALCLYCKMHRAKRENQSMENLPKCRVYAPKFPFGPCNVKVGHCVVKH